MQNIDLKSFGEKSVKVDLCVIGGGLSGICASVSAARHGLKVALIQDRPMLGGNASGEIRMWIRGAATKFPEYREGGIVEEIALKNIYENPQMNFAVWDGVLYDTVVKEENISLFLNTTCIWANEEKNRIKSVKCWRMSSYTFLTVESDYFCDASGDSILAEATSAEYTFGRECKSDYNESYAPELPDKKTMGNSCLMQARETESEVKFVAPSFAYKFSDDEIKTRIEPSCHNLKYENFWWLEVGGDGDALKDADLYQRELIAKCYGIWDYIKNSGNCPRSKNWDLEWVGFLAGKRETRRYIGDYVLTQNDLENSTAFYDDVAYGGWTMDDHDPKGFYAKEPNVHHPIPAPYGIPYRSLYSVNIENLFFAGRNISATHMALSSTRVMATCALMGQAVGAAAFIAKKNGLSCRGVLNEIDRLQKILLDDDCFLLNRKREVSSWIRSSENNLENSQLKSLFSGEERTINGKNPSVSLELNKEYYFKNGSASPSFIRIVFDGDLPRSTYPDDMAYTKYYPMRCSVPLDMKNVFMPQSLVKAYEVKILINGKWELLKKEGNNCSRLVKIAVNRPIDGFLLKFTQTYGEKSAKLFSIDII